MQNTFYHRFGLIHKFGVDTYTMHNYARLNRFDISDLNYK